MGRFAGVGADGELAAEKGTNAFGMLPDTAGGLKLGSGPQSKLIGAAAEGGGPGPIAVAPGAPLLLGAGVCDDLVFPARRTAP